MVQHKQQQQRGYRLPLYVILGGLSVVSLGLNLFAARDLVLHHPDRPEGRGSVSKPMGADSSDRVPLGQRLNSISGDGSSSMTREPLARDSSDNPRLLLHNEAASSASSEEAAGDPGSRSSGFRPSASSLWPSSPSSPSSPPGKGPAPTSSSSNQSSSSSSPSSPWLLIVVPTVRRKVSYLEPVVEALMKQVPMEAWDALYGKVLVRVVNNDKGGHVDFLEAKQALGGKYSGVLEFVEGNTKGSKQWAGMTNVQRQSEDLAYTLREAGTSGSMHIFVVEDDQMLCHNGLLSLQYLIRKAYSYAPGWMAMRTSVGFNGIVLKTRDAMSLATYIEEHKTRRPPDHLFSEWIQRPGSGGQLAGRDGSAKGRPFFAFRHNILYHVGSQSSLGHESRIIVPKCYDTLQDWLQPVEMFHIDQCPHDDVWPCPGGSNEGELRYDKGVVPPVASSKVHMVDWTGARLCGTPCGNPLGVMNLDGSPPKGIEDQKTLERCRDLQKKHGVQIGASWGTMTEQSKRGWMSLDCDRAFS